MPDKDNFDELLKTDLSKKNNDLQIKLNTMETILDMYPHLKKDKEIILNKLLEKKEKKSDDYVLKKVIINDATYWCDPYKYLLNEDLIVVGYCFKGLNGETTYNFMKKYHNEDISKKMKVISKIAKDFSNPK